MKLISVAFCLAAATSVAVGAQDNRKVQTRDKMVTQDKVTTQEKTKTTYETNDSKGARDVTVTGCLERNPKGGYMMSAVEGGMILALTTSEDLSKYLEHTIEVKGKSADANARLTVESKTEINNGDGDKKTVQKVKAKGDVNDLRHMTVGSVRLVKESCE
jgi:hypothetical protein